LGPCLGRIDSYGMTMMLMDKMATKAESHKATLSELILFSDTSRLGDLVATKNPYLTQHNQTRTTLSSKYAIIELKNLVNEPQLISNNLLPATHQVSQAFLNAAHLIHRLHHLAHIAKLLHQVVYLLHRGATALTCPRLRRG
jgi:hypothetical protein